MYNGLTPRFIQSNNLDELPYTYRLMWNAMTLKIFTKSLHLRGQITLNPPQTKYNYM